MTRGSRDAQAARTATVAAEFDASFAAIVADRGWWPDASQVALTRMLIGAGSIAAALEREDFVRALRRSLNRWKAFRGAAVTDEHLASVLRAAAPALDALRHTSIAALRMRDVPRVFDAFDALRDLRPSARKWVATSKTLHHLLPALVVPMDNQITASFLGRASLPERFDAAYLEETYGAFIALREAVGVSRMREAERLVPFPVPDARLRECRVGMARVLDFAVAGYVRRRGSLALRRG